MLHYCSFQKSSDRDDRFARSNLPEHSRTDESLFLDRQENMHGLSQFEDEQRPEFGLEFDRDFRGPPRHPFSRDSEGDWDGNPMHREEFDRRPPLPFDDRRGPPDRDDHRGPPNWDEQRGPPDWDDRRGPMDWDDRRGPPPPDWDDRREPPDWDDRRGPPPPGWDDRRGPPPPDWDDRRGPPDWDDRRDRFLPDR